MFSNPKKFLKKNILLIGIIVLLIIAAIYWLYINVKEGFEGPVPEKERLIAVSTIEKIYNNLPDQTYKDIAAPIVALYKLFADNYNDAFDVSLQIVAATKELDASTVNIIDPQPPQRPDEPLENPAGEGVWSSPTPAGIEYNKAQNDYWRKMDETEELRKKARRNVVQKWSSLINPGVQRVLSNAIRWLPNAKQFYEKFVLNNYYGMFDGTLIQENDAGKKLIISLLVMGANTLYEDDQLTILFGPDFAKSNPNPPIKLPTTYEEFLQFSQSFSYAQNGPSQEQRAALARAQEYLQKYIQNLGIPFMIIQKYLMEDAFLNTGNSIIPNTIINLIEQLNTALANDATDQATIGQLTGQLNTALANDATDQATIHNLQGRVDTLQSQQSRLMPSLPTATTPVSTTPVSMIRVSPKIMPKPMPKPIYKKGQW
jgi:hypothetical protein